MAARILIIDDDPGTRKNASTSLSRLGHKVTTVSGGMQSMRAFHAMSPDIVLIEIVLPDRCGLEIMRDIQRVSPGTRIIAMAGGDGALEQSYLLDVARKLGADLALAKPLHVDALLAAIEQVLQLPQRSDRRWTL